LRALDVDFYADEFARAGFRGGLNWYRNVTATRRFQRAGTRK
jgi:hypothetical protein